MGNIPVEGPEGDKEESDYLGPDYGQKGTNRQVGPPDTFQEEAVDYQQHGAGYVPPGAGQPDGDVDRAGADDEGDASAR
jgi:hypothetical protein